MQPTFPSGVGLESGKVEAAYSEKSASPPTLLSLVPLPLSEVGRRSQLTYFQVPEVIREERGKSVKEESPTFFLPQLRTKNN